MSSEFREYTDKELRFAYDKACTAAFLNSNSAFLGSILCSMTVHWAEADDKNIKTAKVQGTKLFLNKQFFMEKLDEEQRKIVLLHEIWHIANLHALRLGNRDLERFNIACDYEINDILKEDHYDLDKLPGCIYDNSFRGKPAEEIYDLLPPNNNKRNSGSNNSSGNSGGSGSGNSGSSDGNQSSSGGNGTGNGQGNSSNNQNLQNDLSPSPNSDQSAQDQMDQLNAVARATQASRLAGNEPGNITQILNKFLKPVVPWENILNQFLIEKLERDSTWSRPNKRFEDIYLPSTEAKDKGLTHLAFFLDTSGSISEEQLIRFNSELHYIKETFKPEKLTVVQFDYSIHTVQEYGEDDPYEDVEIEGDGGTNYSPVHDYIIKHKPTAAVIFTDLWATAMEPINNIPIFWIVDQGEDTDKSVKGSCGKTIYI